MQKSIWIFGGVAGMLSAYLEYLFYSSDRFHPMSMYLAKMLVLIICVAYGLILVRKLLGGVISVGRTLLTGSLIALVSAAVMITSFSVLYYPDGKFYENKKQESYALAKDKVYSDDQVKEEDKETELEITMQDIDAQFSPLGYARNVIGGNLITAIIFSILMAVFISKNMMYDDSHQKS